MVRGCCVKSCKSKLLKGQGIALHEIPCDPVQRQIWINFLTKENSQKPWSLGERSCICSLHFKETDYKPEHRNRTLLKNAVPSIILPNTKYVETEGRNGRKILIRFDPPVTPTMHDNIIHNECDKKLDEPVAKKSRVDLQENNSNIFKVTRVDFNGTSFGGGQEEFQYLVSLPTSKIVQPLQTVQSFESVQPLDTDQPCIQSTKLEEDLSNTELIASESETSANSVSMRTTKHEILASEIGTHFLNEKVAKLKMKMYNMRSQLYRGKALIQKLQARCEKLELNNNSLFHSFKLICVDAEKDEPSALFLVDQIKAYNKKWYKWSGHTLRECALWRGISTKGYDHIRMRNILNLPCRKTMDRLLYLGDKENESNDECVS